MNSEEKMMHCIVCGVQYQHRADLANHLRLIHGIKSCESEQDY